LLDTRYGTSIRRAAGDAFGNGKPVEVAFRVDRAAFSARPETPAPAPEPQQARVQIAARAQASAAANARCNFENYLVGKSNRLAHAAAVRVADADGYVAPLFLHGSCGMGKTHLLQATVQRYVANHPGSSVRYTTAEAFTNEFVAAIKANRVEAFRRSYRKVDLLAIDDVHFFSSKEATQAELLHTLDAVGLEGARIILASDEHPKEIRKLSDRLSSRFMAGIVVRIEAPDRELRERLVKHLAHRRGMILEDAAIGILVDRTERAIGSLGGFGGSVREIEGSTGFCPNLQARMEWWGRCWCGVRWAFPTMPRRTMMRRVNAASVARWPAKWCSRRSARPLALKSWMCTARDAIRESCWHAGWSRTSAARSRR
jgi:chromosomal replication initiator protein